MMTATHSISCRDASIAFGDAWAVKSMNLEIAGGDIVSLIGPSGCGKTTLLRAMAGLQSLTEGTISIGDGDRPEQGSIGFVFQQPSLLPWATALENVMLPLDLIGRGTRSQRRDAAMASLESVQLDSHHAKRPAELSGGMQMRASIARALVTDPSVLLLDEPFAALDDMLRADLGELVLALWERRRFTGVMVTHNIGESILISHQIAIMRSGRLEALVDNPVQRPRRWSQMREPSFGAFFGEVSDRLRGASSEESADE